MKFLIFLLLLSSFHAADAQSYKCPSPELTYTANSIFRRNLDDLLASLAANASSLPGFFYNTTVGSIPDRVYGLVQCHRDVSAGECRSCATSSASQLRQVCTNSKVAMFWRDDCFIRYSVYNFLGVVDKIQEEMENPNSISSPSRFEPFLLSFLRNLTTSATTGGSSPVYVTGAVPYANSLTVYGLVECTGDLSPASCRSCLNNSIDGIRCCTDRVGARILSGSCVVRYEIYPFFANFSTATTLTPPATNWSASPAPLPALPLGKGGIGFWKILAMIVPIEGVLLGLAGGAHIGPDQVVAGLLEGAAGDYVHTGLETMGHSTLVAQAAFVMGVDLIKGEEGGLEVRGHGDEL
ncbi:Cysteine-rich repeat secretory protein 38 [Nymphaea thermarum]|nr:Cysteine-rich repeat secretory protein 38 [Nymphaea thermarum]